MATSGQVVAAPRNPQGVEPKKDPPKKDQDATLPSELPAGPLHIIVSIGKQRAELYSNGEPIISMPVSTGTADHPTPTGVFSILQKRTWHESNIYSAAPMPFMQRITWSGVALHEGVLPGYPASHGCIRLPRSFATWLFGFTDLGVRVIVAKDDPKVEDITHPLLFASRRISGSGAELISQETGIVYRANVSIPASRKLTNIDADAGNAQDAARIDTISVFISKKEGRMFVRRNFASLFDAPVHFENRQRPIGTHVFTAMDFNNRGPDMRWTVVSMKSEDTSDELHDRYSIDERWVGGRAIRTAWFSRERWTPLPPDEVLDRIYIPQEAIDRISEFLTPGSSLIVSDEGLNKEIRKHTEFVVLTSPPAAFLKPETADKDRRRALRQEPVTRTQPVAPQTPQRTRPDDAPAVDDRRPVIRPTAAEPVALQSSRNEKSDAAAALDKRRSISHPTPAVSAETPSLLPAKLDVLPIPDDRRDMPRPTPAAQAVTPSLQPAELDAAQRAEDQHSVSGPTGVEPAAPQSSRRAGLNAAHRVNSRRVISRTTNEELAATQSRRANFEDAPRVDNRRSIYRSTNSEPAAPQSTQGVKFDASARADDRRSISRAAGVEAAVKKIELVPP
ncbi:MAG: L,D-transpeptidase family protein [Rhizobiales bacterium]|nr:L,D-transpeptidase family protein [Hyphomicrobiales bacterium]